LPTGIGVDASSAPDDPYSSIREFDNQYLNTRFDRRYEAFGHHHEQNGNRTQENILAEENIPVNRNVGELLDSIRDSEIQRYIRSKASLQTDAATFERKRSTKLLATSSSSSGRRSKGLQRQALGIASDVQNPDLLKVCSATLIMSAMLFRT
jgi:BRCT domain type II-containing protein